jgi:hypothetical protein
LAVDAVVGARPFAFLFGETIRAGYQDRLNGPAMGERATTDFAGFLAWGFKDLFSNANIKLQTFLNYGLAALVYLAIGAVLKPTVPQSGLRTG